MSQRTIYADIHTRRLVAADGGAAVLPSFVLGDKCNCTLNILDSSAGDATPRELAVRSLRAMIGATMDAPTSGSFTLKLGIASANATAALTPASNAAAIKTAIDALPEAATYPLAEVTLAAPSCWLLRFESDEPVPIQAAVNSLSPRAFVRVRAYQINDVWWHEMRLIVAALAFTGLYDRVLPAPPSIDQVRAGSTHTAGSTINTNEVQSLHVPVDFNGTYYLRWDYRTTALLGVDDGPDEIAAALNKMFGDGTTRFEVNNPELATVYIEFVGPLADAPQSLIAVTVHSFAPGPITFALDVGRPEMAAALRAVKEIEVPFEVELEVVEDGEDPLDDAVPGERITLFQELVKVVREGIWEELEQIPEIDWLRPPQPRNYTPFVPGQIIIGSQHYIAVIGDATARIISLPHMLGTQAMHIAVRENVSGGRLLGTPGEFEVTFPSANAAELTFATPPALNALAVTLTTAGPRSAFQDHTHSIAQVLLLQDALDALAARLASIEDRLPFTSPGTTATVTGGALEIVIPDSYQMFPGRFAPTFDFKSGIAPARPGALFPAIHTATNYALTTSVFPALSASIGKVYYNNTGAPLLVQGSLGHKSISIAIGEFVGCDGRAWYPVTRDGPTNSYFPTDMERQLFVVPINDRMLRPGMAFRMEFSLSLQMLASLTAGQYLLVVETGDPQQDTTPAVTGVNLKNVVWNTATPMLSQRIIVSGIKETIRAGLAVRRAVDGTLAADRLLYNTWEGGAQTPASANFALRARLIQWDTENSVANARGCVFAAFTDAVASVA